jgi:hypothetical protein
MTTLDARARRASMAIYDSVATASPAVSFPTALRRHRIAQITAGVLATAAVVVLIALGALVRTQASGDVADSVPPKVEEPAPEVVPPPVFDDTDGEQAAPDPESTEPTGQVEGSTDPQVDPGAEPTTTTTTTTEAPPADTRPPILTIDSPEDGTHLEAAEVRFSGTTEPGAIVAAGRWFADVSAEGRWSIVLFLTEGANHVAFVAVDAAGNQARAAVTVHLDPSPPTTTRPPKDDRPPAVAFTAHNVYGECSETPPFDVYYGTAAPGATITVRSEFGFGSATADAEGRWEIMVFFPEAPIGTSILVIVRDDEGNATRFEFVRTG